MSSPEGGGTTQQNNHGEHQHTPETVTPHRDLKTLQARFLLGGDALNPNKNDLPALTKETIPSSALRDYSAIEKASQTDRKAHWEQTTAADQKKQWIDQTTTHFATTKRFFAENQHGKDMSNALSVLGINTQQFTNDTAESLYTKYFGVGEAPITHFVADVISKHKKADNTIDHAALEKNLPAIQWLAGIFGTQTEVQEIIAQYVLAESKRHDEAKTKELLEQVNHKETHNGSESLKLNTLQDKEKALLTFLWSYQEPATPQPQRNITDPYYLSPQLPKRPKLPAEYKITYERKEGDDRFVDADSLREVIDPNTIALMLKHDYPLKYQDKPTETINHEIEQQQTQLKRDLASHGLTDEYFGEILTKRLNQYEDFLRTTYGVTLPNLEQITVVPITGDVAYFHNRKKDALAFVHPAMPAIFLDFDVIGQEAQKRKIANGWQNLSKEQIGQLLDSLLTEINPHEYTHLIGDMAYWKLQHNTKTNYKTGKIGLDIARPKPPYHNEDDFLQVTTRGIGLNEAVTVELTNKWVQSLNKQSKLEAYVPERQVLAALLDVLAQDKGISQNEAFKYFVNGYFSAQGFRRLGKELSGPTSTFKETVTTKKGKTIDVNRVVYKRPHLLEMVYGLMEYETKNNSGHYPLTLDFVRHANELTRMSDTNKQRLRALLLTPHAADSSIRISPSARHAYLKKLGSSSSHSEHAATQRPAQTETRHLSLPTHEESGIHTNTLSSLGREFLHTISHPEGFDPMIRKTFYPLVAKLTANQPLQEQIHILEQMRKQAKVIKETNQAVETQHMLKNATFAAGLAEEIQTWINTLQSK